MGQKSNVVTIRKSQLQFSAHEKKNKQIILLYVLLEYLQKVFLKLNVCLLDNIIQHNMNKIYVNFILFFRTRKLIQLKKKIKRTKKYTSNFSLSSLLKFFKLVSKSNLIVFSIKVINNTLTKKNKLNNFLLIHFFNLCNRYSKLLFPRRLNFFLDFIKISVLLFLNKIKITYFLKLLSETLTILQKKRHSLYLQFLKFFFNLLINPTKKAIDYIKKDPIDSSILGIKFTIAGKLKGKQRASSNCLILGNIPIQTIKSNIQFSKVDAFTVYGIFGLKLWVNRKLK